MDARRRIPTAALAVAAALAAAAPAAAATDDDTAVIAPGTLVGGIDLGGQTIAQAAATLDAQLKPRLLAPVTVRIAGRTFQIGGTRAGVRLDALRTARRAYYAGRDAAATTTPTPAPATPPSSTTTPAATAPATTTSTGPETRTAARRDGGAVPGVSVPPAVSVSTKAVRAWAGKVAARTSRAPRDARLRIGVTRMRVIPARRGMAVDASRLASKVVAAFKDPAASRTIRQERTAVDPKVTVADLRRQNATIVTVDRGRFTLRLFKNLKLVKRYPIAIGMAGMDTPAGLYSIANKAVNPAWHVPNSAWAGSLAGQVIPGGAPNNPLKARWLGIVDGVGIHGTAEEWSIGTRASHGCIRMRVRDVIDLYPRVPVGAKVLIR
ncbi:MAG: L,D-transpeptidase family protein [Solirubrobacteraceae bacterium]|nr:L,D-transpeptidase family protein [Solirubrobacteraceae bacterium]